MKIFPTGTIKTAQEIYRGDPNPLDIKDFNPEYALKELGKDLGSSAAWGPGIYFTAQLDIAQMYGSNITKKVLNNANILTKQSPLFTRRQIEKILQGIDKEKLETAYSNWDESPILGRRMMIESIFKADNPLEQLMNIWADVFYHQNPNAFIELMVKNGIDGISIIKAEDEIYYVIYNRNVLT